MPQAGDKAVVLLSGGLDSTTLFWMLEAAGVLCLPMAVNYGQRHSKELEHATGIAQNLGRDLQIVDLTGLRLVLRGSCQTVPTIPVPHGHYADETMRATVTPNRNMILLSTAAAYAISEGAGFVAYAAHAGDHPIYPDCRPEFIAAMTKTLQLCHYSPIHLVAPFGDKSKADLVRIGTALGVPYHLTWSCYDDGKLHCGLCGTCVERREAFVLAGVPDPTIYQGHPEDVLV